MAAQSFTLTGGTSGSWTVIGGTATNLGVNTTATGYLYTVPTGQRLIVKDGSGTIRTASDNGQTGAPHYDPSSGGTYRTFVLSGGVRIWNGTANSQFVVSGILEDDV